VGQLNYLLRNLWNLRNLWDGFLFLGFDGEQPRVSELTVNGPFNEPNLHNDLWFYPMRSHTW
jgi:hypothetical protein